VVVDSDGMVVHASRLPEADQDRLGWLARQDADHGPGLELVVTELTAREDALAMLSRLALDRGYRVWVAPRKMVLPMCRAAWGRPNARQAAALLARLPRVAVFRAVLRRAPLSPGTRQLRLFRDV
jgi:hypothetical protein